MDVSHEKFRGLYMATLRAELARVGRAVDFIVVSHTEPDHSGARWGPETLILDPQDLIPQA